MSRPVSGHLCLAIACSLTIYGCSKSTPAHSNDVSSGDASNTALSYFTTDPSQSPYYGDTVLYVQGSGRSAYLYSPVSTLGTGKYLSWPAGLMIDGQTGVIDLLQSEPGARYNVGFIRSGTKDTVYSQVILAGVTYPDGIYFMDSKDSVLMPYYNNGLYTPSLNEDQISPERSGTNPISSNGVFDEDGPAGLRANDQQLKVNIASGSINLKNSIRSGLFGSAPQNGDNKKISIYYRLNDNSKMNLQKTSVVLHYYNTLSDVPSDLVSACLSSQLALAQQPKAVAGSDSLNVRNITVYATTSTPAPTSVTAKSTPTPAPAPTAPRPPQLVIVNTGHH